MTRIPLHASALAAAMNAELYRRGVPAFVRVGHVVRVQPGTEWTFALERSPVPLNRDATAERYLAGLFRWQDEVEAVAQWAAERFTVAWDDEAPRAPVFIPAPEPLEQPAYRGEAVGAEHGMRAE